MLVCRDIKKAKEKYGFEWTDKTETTLEREVATNFHVKIYQFGNVSFEAWDCWDEDINLEFLYDMSKDGILEKV